MAGPIAQHLIAGGLHGVIADRGINHGMEGDVGIDPGPVPGIAVSPLGENAPPGVAPVQHPVSHLAGAGLGPRGAQHPPDRNRILVVFVQAVHRGHLVRHIHRNGIGHRRGFRRGPGRGARHHDPTVVKDHVPGSLIHLARGFQAVLSLNGLHCPQGLPREIAADRSVIVSQRLHPALEFLHQGAAGAALQGFRIGNITSGRGVCRGAVRVIHQVSRQLRPGRSGCRAVFSDGFRAVQKLLGGHIRRAGGRQAVRFLKGAEALLGAAEKVPADFSFIISQLRQPALQPLHLISAGAIAQRAVLGRKDPILGLPVRDAGLFQAIIPLEAFDRFPGAFPVSAGKIAGIVLQILQPVLQLQHVVPFVPVLQIPGFQNLLHQIFLIRQILRRNVRSFVLIVHGNGFSALHLGKRYSLRFRCFRRRCAHRRAFPKPLAHPRQQAQHQQ